MQQAIAFGRFTIALLVLTTGCTTPAARFDRAADSQGLTRVEDRAGPFVHVRFHKGRAGPGRPLHIYVDGDGDSAARDPTTTERLVLKLMAADPAAAVLIGRPCYYLIEPDPHCDASLWRSKRYSQSVIDNMTSAVNRVLVGLPDAPVTLIGYSGGGAIASLIAARVARVERVITIAANLDIDAWAEYHHGAAPPGSLNPADGAPLRSAIMQWHLYGSDDRIVPASTAARYLDKQLAARLSVIDGYDHRCCWEEIWTDVLAERLPIVAESPEDSAARR